MTSSREQGVYTPSKEYAALLRRMRRPYIVLSLITITFAGLMTFGHGWMQRVGIIGSIVFLPIAIIATLWTGWVAGREMKRDYVQWCERTGLVDDRWRMR